MPEVSIDSEVLDGMTGDTSVLLVSVGMTGDTSVLLGNEISVVLFGEKLDETLVRTTLVPVESGVETVPEPGYDWE